MSRIRCTGRGRASAQLVCHVGASLPSNQNQCKRAKGHMAPRPFVLRASRCRFAAARRAGASMQMSRVVALIHFGLPCWCFMAQQAKRQRFVCCQTIGHFAGGKQIWRDCTRVLAAALARFFDPYDFHCLHCLFRRLLRRRRQKPRRPRSAVLSRGSSNQTQ